MASIDAVSFAEKWPNFLALLEEHGVKIPQFDASLLRNIPVCLVMAGFAEKLVPNYDLIRYRFLPRDIYDDVTRQPREVAEEIDRLKNTRTKDRRGNDVTVYEYIFMYLQAFCEMLRPEIK